MNLLFVANFPPGVGYAWDTIEQVFRGVAIRWKAAGGRVFICYPPGGEEPPASFREAGIEFLDFDYMTVKTSQAAVLRFIGLLRRHRINVLYLTDKSSWRWHYPLLRAAGVKRIIIHDRTSGERSERPGVLGALKRAWHRIPGLSADVLIGVSQFVASRMLASGTPPHRTFVVYNGIPLEKFANPRPGALAEAIGVPVGTPIIFVSGRAHHYKGIDTLIRAAARIKEINGAETPIAYCGDGPALEEFKATAAALGLEGFHCLGRRSDVPDLLGTATVAVIPSRWAEAFGLAVVEAMAAGVPVVATEVGGIPELVDEGVTGLLVPPDDPEAMARAINRLLHDPQGRAAMAAAGRAAAQRRFAIDRVVDELFQLVYTTKR
jgi:glycosyltransferase involved in cell wall biosynthesis